MRIGSCDDRVGYIRIDKVFSLQQGEMASNFSKEERKLLPWVLSVKEPGLSKDDMLKIYSEWNTSYEEGVLSSGYGAPTVAVKHLAESFPSEERDKVRIIDIGAGTGLVARGLRKLGFCRIDGVDPSEDMLAMAKKDALYENYICEFVTDKQLPIVTGAYDGLTACGCFIPNHMQSDALPELLRIVKPGGIIVIVSRADYIDTVPDYKANLIPVMDKFVQDGIWKLLVAEVTGYYHFGHEAMVWKFQVLKNCIKE